MRPRDRAALRLVIAVLAGAMAPASSALADSVSYIDPAGQGTQNWGGNLALTFTVNSPITVTDLGVFNASGSGIIAGSIQVAIYDISTSTLVTPVVTFHGTYLIEGLGYDVYQTIAPVVLAPGNYEVDAVGFGADPNGNLNTGSSTGPQLNNLGGALTFTGAAWDSDFGGLDYPTSCPSCVGGSAQARQFDAGTFSVPEPSSVRDLVAMLALLGIATWQWRRHIRLA